eukprot:359472-Chlamydomonas_euryale.AAC.10
MGVCPWSRLPSGLPSRTQMLLRCGHAPVLRQARSRAAQCAPSIRMRRAASQAGMPPGRLAHSSPCRMRLAFSHPSVLVTSAAAGRHSLP